MLADIPGEQTDEALEAVAREALAEGGWTAPPVDSIALARRLGIVVARSAATDVRAHFARLGGAGGSQPTILLADDPRPERCQWAVAHEIGESLAYRVFGALGVDPSVAPAAAREDVANQLAGRLLLPGDWFAADGLATDWDLAELKARFAPASHELIARRMLQMRPAVIITLFDLGRARWRQSNRLHRPPPLTAAEQDAQRAAHATGCAVRCERGDLPEGIADVRAWAIHEPQWKREIVRTELEEW